MLLFIILLVIVVIVAANAIKIVPQSEVLIVEDRKSVV